MKLELNKLYHYIYGDWADIEKHIKPDLSAEIKAKLIKEKLAKIRKFFANTQLQNTIHAAKNYKLENILYGNTLTYSFYKIDEKEIEKKLTSFESSMQLLVDANGLISQDLRNQFQINFKICKIIAGQYEQNNELIDTCAYRNAYIMLVIFGANPKNYFGSIEKYLEKHNYFNTSPRPLHDALYHRLPQISKDKIHLESWRKLIQIHGPKILRLFNMAPAIEQKLGGRAPLDFKEAQETASNVCYKRAAENLKLANLFIEFNLDESLFNKALEIEEKRKKRDNLPNITVAGVDIKPEFANYHLVKLPIDDPSAYILGHLTNCCQSLGGNSEVCIIDGITRENNGFYVLLKSKLPEKKTDLESKIQPLINGKINAEKFSIVGQGYAWLSTEGNLVIDSWENKNPEHDDKIISKLLRQFAILATEINEITTVTIGAGGKTPIEFLYSTILSPQVMLEGTQYGDSKEQATIFCNFTRLNKLLLILESKLLKILNAKEDRALLLWIVSKCGSIKVINQTLSLQMPELVEIINTLKKSPFHNSFPSWKLILNLATNKILTTDAIKWFKHFEDKKSRDHVNYMFSSAVKISSAGFSCDDKIYDVVSKRLDKNRDVIDHIIKILIILRQTNLEYDEHMRSLFLSSPNFVATANDCQIALNMLQDAKLDNDINIVKLVFSRQNEIETAKSCISAFSLLREAKLDADVEIRNVIVKSLTPQLAARSILRAIEFGFFQDILIRQMIICSHRDPIYAINIMCELKTANLLHDSFLRSHLLKNKYDPSWVKSIITAIKILNKVQLENDLDIKKLVLKFANPDVAANYVANTIEYLKEIKMDFVGHTRDSYLRSIECGWRARDVFHAFAILKEYKITMDDVLYRHILNSFEPVNQVWLFIRHLKVCQDLDLDQYADIRQCLIEHSSIIASYIIDAMLILKQEKLLDNNAIRFDVLNRKSRNNPVSSAYAIVKLKAANLENIADIRSAVLSQDDPEKSARTYVKLNSQSKLELKPISITCSADEFFARFRQFIKCLEDSLLSLPNSSIALRLFPSKNICLYQKCIEMLKKLKSDLNSFTPIEAEKQLLLILVKLHSDLVQAKSSRCLNYLNAFLKKQQIVIPDELRFVNCLGPSDNISYVTPNDSMLFKLILPMLHKALEKCKLVNDKEHFNTREQKLCINV